MSIHDQIASHPDVAGNLNQALATAVRHAMFCGVICTSCADACVAEQGRGMAGMDQCIRLCLDCADICAATATVAARRTGQNIETLKAMLAVCADACERCAAECDRHDHDHCRRCAQMCRECAADCRAAIGTVN